MSSLPTPRLERYGASSYPVNDVNERIGPNYRRFEALAGLNIHIVALAGVNGSVKYLLSRAYQPVFDEGYHDFSVRDGRLYGGLGSGEDNLGSQLRSLPRTLHQNNFFHLA